MGIHIVVNVAKVVNTKGYNLGVLQGILGSCTLCMIMLIRLACFLTCCDVSPRGKLWTSRWIAYEDTDILCSACSWRWREVSGSNPTAAFNLSCTFNWPLEELHILHICNKIQDTLVGDLPPPFMLLNTYLLLKPDYINGTGYWRIVSFARLIVASNGIEYDYKKNYSLLPPTYLLQTGILQQYL